MIIAVWQKGKKMRLIELFAGYGSQALALKYLNIPFEHWFVCEIDENVIKTYNDSIVVNVLMAIFDNLLNKDFEQTTLF